MSKRSYRILHIEDEGEYRRVFSEDVLREGLSPFRAVHLNKAEERLSDAELAKKAVSQLGPGSDVKFVVVDLAMDNSQHLAFDAMFTTDDYPTTPPDGLPGGIGIVTKILRDSEFRPENIAFLTRHAPSSVFTKLNNLTKHWFGFSIPHFLKDRADDISALQELIAESVSWEGTLSGEKRSASRVSIPVVEPGVQIVVVCLSDNEKTLSSVGEQVMELWKDDFKPHYEQLRISGEGHDAFQVLQEIVNREASIAEELVRVAIFAVVDFTFNKQQDDALEFAIERKDWSAVSSLPGVTQLQALVSSGAAHELKRLFKVVALTNALHLDKAGWLERSFMRKVGVDYVVDQATITAEFLKKTVKFLTAIQPLAGHRS